MADQPETASSSSGRDDKLMFVAAFVIVLVMLGGMGINMLVHKETNAGTVETTTSPRE